MRGKKKKINRIRASNHCSVATHDARCSCGSGVPRPPPVMRRFKRLISALSAIYHSVLEQDAEPPKAPNVESQCPIVFIWSVKHFEMSRKVLYNYSPFA